MTVAKALFEGFAARDKEQLLPLFSRDVELWTRVQVLPERHFKGLDAVDDWLRTVDDEFDHFEIVDPQYKLGSGGAVMVSSQLSLRYAGDSYGQARRVHWVLRVDDGGLISSFRSFRDRSEALRAAGIRSEDV